MAVRSRHHQRRTALALATVGAALFLPAAASHADGSSVVIAVIGDTPYGAATPGGPQAPDGTAFPNLASSINADPNVSLVMHLGDIKSGSTQCSDAYFSLVKDWFNGTNGKGPGLADPLVYTPGDNEWTDCHRANNGAHVPTSNGTLPAGRLEALRGVFYPVPGQTLGAGAPRTLVTQATTSGFATFVENTMWTDADVQFGVVHVVGSNNGALPWFTQAGQTPQSPAQVANQAAELAARRAAALAWVDTIFDTAIADGREGVVIGMQADTWDTSAAGFLGETDAIVAKIAQRTLAYGKPVLLLQGDSHTYKIDNPLDGSTASAAMAALHPYNPSADPVASPPVPNFTRVVVPGSNGASPNGIDSWLALTIDPTTPAVFSIQLKSATVPPVDVPEAPLTVLLPLTALAATGAVALVRQRRRAA